MATYRIVDMYRKSKAVKGIHYDSWDEPILAYRVDKRHSLLFGLIHYWEYGANNLFPVCSFYSVNEAHKNINGTYSPVLPFPTNEMAFNDFIYNVKYFTGNKYLVTGNLLDKTGTDGEPLIKNVKILKKL